MRTLDEEIFSARMKDPYLKQMKNLKLLIIFLTVIAGILGFYYSFLQYPQVFKVYAASENNLNVGPKQSVTVNFSEPILSGGYLGKITISPQEEINVALSSSKQLIISPKNSWKPETDYAVNLPEGRSIMLTKIENFSFNFRTVDYPKVANFFPANGSQDVVLDIEDPIVVDFSQTAKDFYIKLAIDPAEDLEYQVNEEKTQLKAIPKNKVGDGVDYNVKVYAKSLYDSGDNFKEIYTSSFKTKPSQVVEKNFDIRLANARKYNRAQIIQGKYIDINLSNQTLCTFEGGINLDCYMVSTGKRGMETPKGSYQIRNKSPRVWSKAYGLFMPFWMAVAPDGKFGIHELPEWPGGYKEGANHLGVPVSHGCIRLGVGPAKIVYDWAGIGTPVVIH